jgi:hypothetical protein
MDPSYFARGIIILGGLEDVCDSEGRNTHQRMVTHRFDKALIHNIRTAMEQLEQSGFKRREHPPYHPDLARYDFFLLVA